MTTYQYASPWGFREHQRGLRAVGRVSLRRRPWVRAVRIGFPIVLLAVLFGGRLLAGELQFDLVSVVSLLPWLLFLVLWIVLLRWGEFYLAARRTRRLDPSAKGTLTRTFSAEGFRIDGAGQSVVLTWKGVHSAVETREFLLIFLNKACAYYVPKRLIPTPDELQAVRDLLRANLGERAQLGPPSTARAA
jgi:hypothetical protein